MALLDVPYGTTSDGARGVANQVVPMGTLRFFRRCVAIRVTGVRKEPGPCTRPEPQSRPPALPAGPG